MLPPPCVHMECQLTVALFLAQMHYAWAVSRSEAPIYFRKTRSAVLFLGFRSCSVQSNIQRLLPAFYAALSNSVLLRAWDCRPPDKSNCIRSLCFASSLGMWGAVAIKRIASTKRMMPATRMRTRNALLALCSPLREPYLYLPVAISREHTMVTLNLVAQTF